MESNDSNARAALGQQAGALVHSLDRCLYLSQALSDFNIPLATITRVQRWLEQYAGVPDYANAYEVLGTPFEDAHDELVIVKDISFTALCEHHLLPFQGKAAIGYIPNGKVVGLSKNARLVEYMCKWPTLQEHITTRVADCFNMFLEPKGVMVVLYDVTHSCMSTRGVKQEHAVTITSALRGVFKESSAARMEFLELIK